MKITTSLLCLCIFTFSNFSFAQSAAKSDNKKVNRPLKNINYMGVNVRVGVGFNSPKLNIDNEWSATSGLPYYFGIGYSFALKNAWAFDLQLTEEIASYEVSNKGPYFKTGYMSSGAEIGIKKTFAKKTDDTFFFRAAFGYNFLITANKNGATDYFNYATTTSGTSMYALPEVGYQLRLADARHLINFSVNYKYSLSKVATASMNYFETGKTPEVNTLEMNGSYAGINISYIFIIKAFEDNERINKKVDSHF